MAGKRRFPRVLLICLLWVALFCPAGALGACFQGLGHLPGADWSVAYGVSGNGRVVVGQSGDAFRWTRSGGLQKLGDTPEGYYGTRAYAASEDGSVVVGELTPNYPGYSGAFRWTAAGGFVNLGALYENCNSVAYCMSSDGTVVAGSNHYAFRWTEAEGMRRLEVGSGDCSMYYAHDMSADRSVIVGECFACGPGLWTQEQGGAALPPLPGGDQMGSAYGISADGLTIVGSSLRDGKMEAFRWTEEEGTVGLGYLSEENSFSVARAVSADGSVIVGFSGGPGPASEAFIWDPANGMRSLEEVLMNDYGLDLTGWELGRPYGVSRDGLVIVGDGTNPEGELEAWIADLRPGCGKAMPWLMLLLDGQE